MFFFFSFLQNTGLLRKGLLLRITLLMSGGASILYIRWRIMGTGPPAFTEVDNPASFADSLFVRVSYEVAFFWPAQNICLCRQIGFSFLCFKETIKWAVFMIQGV